jgi:hypothetical protein
VKVYAHAFAADRESPFIKAGYGKTVRKYRINRQEVADEWHLLAASSRASCSPKKDLF